MDSTSPLVPQHGYEVSPRRRSPNAYPVGIEIVLFCISANPADSGLAVVNLSWPLRLSIKAVADGDSGVIATGHKRFHCTHPALFPRQPPP